MRVRDIILPNYSLILSLLKYKGIKTFLKASSNSNIDTLRYLSVSI